MPYFPQYSGAKLVEFANYRTITQGTNVSHTSATNLAVTANPGDVINNVVVSGDASAYVVTLPPVAQGGPVQVKVSGIFGQVSNSVTIIPQVVDTVAGCLIEGFGSITLTQPTSASGSGSSVVLASDGLQWWIISRAVSTLNTW
jgi:hypothetical protein